MEEFDLTKVSQKLDSLLKTVDLSTTTEDGTKSTLPDGYYLCEVVSAKLGESKSSGNPMVTISYRTISDGYAQVVNDYGIVDLEVKKNTTGKQVWANNTLTSASAIQMFVSDMLKFRDPSSQEQLFTNDDFTTTLKISEALEKLIDMGTITYLNVTSKPDTNDPKKINKNYHPITWKRAEALGLDVSFLE